MNISHRTAPRSSTKAKLQTFLMTYEMSHIEGPHQIPGFNGVGEINLEDYIKKMVLPPRILAGKFSHIGSLDLSIVDENDPMWENVGIREEGNTRDRIETFENTYEVEGFNTDFVPPMIGTDGKPRDGRGRVIAAKRRGEKFIPAFYYVIEDDSEKSRVSDGLTQNLRHPASFTATMESVVIGCLYIIKCGELALNEVGIRNYLHNELNIEKSFSTGNITKIINSILKRGVAGGDPLVHVKDRKKWEAYCEKSGKKVDNKTVFLLSADSDTYAYRAWCQHILPSIVKNDSPIEIILFSNNHIPAEARKNIEKFQDNVKFFLDASYLMVEKDYAPGWTMGELKLPVKSVPYKILGCIPQVIGKHDSYARGYRFVNIENY
tara:strand:- start:145 stop:1278 length:1134 start_codon:yes stop_codon:yes gene_type:complete